MQSREPRLDVLRERLGPAVVLESPARVDEEVRARVVRRDIPEERDETLHRGIEQWLQDVRLARRHALVVQAGKVADDEVGLLLEHLRLSVPHRARVLLLDHDGQVAQGVGEVVGVGAAGGHGSRVVDAAR